MSGEKTDAELVREARNGERAALEQLAHRWSARVLAVCLARVRHVDIAEDLSQESLLRGLQHLETLQAPEKFGAWLRGIAVRVCLDWRRRRARRPMPLSSLNGTGLDTPDPHWPSAEPSEQDDERRQLARQIDDLPEELRETLLLYYFDEMTYQQIADLLDVSRATVNGRLSKARGALARRLAPKAWCNDEL